MSTLVQLLRALNERAVRYVGIGVWGANHYARSPAGVVRTKDKDLFMPPDAGNLLSAWQACEEVGLDLLTEQEPLDQPRDQNLADAVVERRALTHATDGGALLVDFTLVMSGFETVWQERRILVRPR